MELCEGVRRGNEYRPWREAESYTLIEGGLLVYDIVVRQGHCKVLATS